MTNYIDYAVKFVHPDWYLDYLKDKRVGFPGRESNSRFTKGSKLLIYLTTAKKEHMYSPIVKQYQRRMVGIYTVLGDFTDGEHFPDKKPGYPLNLPVEIEYLKNDPREGLSLISIQQKLPWFRPKHGQSHQPLLEEDYSLLRKMLITS